LYCFGQTSENDYEEGGKNLKMKNPKFKPPLLLGAAAMFGIAVTSSLAQELPEKLPTKEDLAKDNKLFAELATKYLHWDEPTDPIHIVGPLYFVGTRGLSSWLFVTSEGNILLNTGTPNSGPMIVESIKKLGFKPEDIKIIINGHGHSDHAGAFAYFKQLTGAQIAIMQEDVAMIEDGGKSDFHYGKDWQIMGQLPVKVDRVLRDGDTVRLGEVVLTAYHTPGHTKGATTWVTTLIEEGKAYKVVFPDGGGFNPGYKVAKPEEYPGINKDYRNTLHFLENLRPDIWGGHHTEISIWKGNGSVPRPKELRHGWIPKVTGASSPVSVALSKMKWTWKWARRSQARNHRPHYLTDLANEQTFLQTQLPVCLGNLLRAFRNRG
jgi:metallo-beta-lactamase class B